MNSRRAPTLRCGGLGRSLLASAWLWPSVLFAQAWLPPAGEGYVLLLYQSSDVGDHLLSTSILEDVDYGSRRFDFGDIDGRTAFVTADYGLSPRWALGGSLAHVESRYRGDEPDNLAVDDGAYHGGLQDVSLGVRYLALRGPTVVTPSATVVIPTRDYETFGHVAIGKGLNELRLGLNAGRAFGLRRRQAYVEGAYSYAIVEKVEDIGLNRSNARLAFGYLPTAKLSLRVFSTWTKTHGGIDWVDDVHEEHEFQIHDQAAAAQEYDAGVGAAYVLGPELDLSLSLARTLTGENTHELTVVSIGLGYGFGRRERLAPAAAAGTASSRR